MAAITKPYDYAVPDTWIADGRSDRLAVGTMVRVPFSGRRVAGWIVELDVEPPEGILLKPLSRLSGVGPPEDIVDLARWAAWRWAGAVPTVLRTANPPKMVAALSTSVPQRTLRPVQDPLVARALEAPGTVVRLAPAEDPFPFVMAAASLGNVLVLAPSVREARVLGGKMRRAGVRVGLVGRDWALGRAGASMVGGRAAAFAPVADLAAIVMLDEHDPVYQEERTPTWHARDVAAERARRAGIPLVLVSPMPTPEANHLGLHKVALERSRERSGWPLVRVIDRRDEPPGKGLWSDELVRVLRDGGRVAAILNRKGRSRLLACSQCGELAICETCGGSMRQQDESELVCSQGDSRRPIICGSCSSTRFKNLRVGVTRAAEELEALVRERVIEVTGDTDAAELIGARVMVGTEALLHKIDRADAVVFLDFDQQLAAGRYRAAEEALGSLVRAARLVGGRQGRGRVLVQTRQPEHRVLKAAVAGDPSLVMKAEASNRESLGFPPFGGLAAVSGAAAEAFILGLGTQPNLTIRGPMEGTWRVQAPSARELADGLAAAERPPGRLRVTVDPLRL